MLSVRTIRAIGAIGAVGVNHFERFLHVPHCESVKQWQDTMGLVEIVIYYTLSAWVVCERYQNLPIFTKYHVSIMFSMSWRLGLNAE